MIALAPKARAQEIAELLGETAQPRVGHDFYLEVFINGRPIHMITRFRDMGDMSLSADAQELRNSGITPDSVAARGEVRLDDIAGLDWTVDLQAQTIHFTAPDPLLAARILDAQGGDAESGEGGTPEIDHGFGLVLNYGLTLDGWKSKGGPLGHSVAGSFDTRLFTPMGGLNHGFTLSEGDAGAVLYRRLDTYWRSSFPSRAVQMQLGDLATRGPSWARPVRLGGLSVEKNFAIRPDLITLPLPSFEGRADLPSTIEVFADSIRSYSVDVPAGPFRLEGLPLSGRSGMAQVKVTDVTGRERQLELPFFVAEDQLRQGTLDFGLAVGYPRLGIGTATDHYDEALYGVASFRYGLNDRLTLNAYFEGGPELVLGGLGGTMGLGPWGTASVNLAQSQSGSETGQLMDVSTRLTFGKTQISAQMLQTEGRFRDIASLAAVSDLVDPTFSDQPKRSLGLSLATPFTDLVGGNVSLFVSDVEYRNGRQESSLGAFYNRDLWGVSNLSLSMMAQSGEVKDTVIGASLYIPLGNRSGANTSIEHSQGHTRSYLSAQGRSESGLPRHDWRLQASQSDSRFSLQGTASREGQLGRAEVGARVTKGGSSLGLRLDGSVVVAGGGIFMARRIQDAFAVADVGAPDVEIKADNRLVGVTNRSGKALVTGLRAWEENTLTIDPANLPLDAAIASTSQTVRPAFNSGTRVTFGVEASASEAIVQLRDQAGQPLEVGGNIVVNGVADGALIGFDGEAYLLGLQDKNVVEVSYPDGRTCSARFDYADEPGILTELRDVPCL